MRARVNDSSVEAGAGNGERLVGGPLDMWTGLSLADMLGLPLRQKAALAQVSVRNPARVWAWMRERIRSR